jgi:4-hydroxyphenylacetate 3-monooxygenase
MAFSGREFIESLDDGREVWFRGERVRNVPAHAGFRMAARSIARLYDTLRDPELARTVAWTTERGALSHKAFRIARTRQQLLERADAMRAWARLHYGFLGRSPDYKSGLAVSLGASPSFFGRFEGNCRRWYERMADELLFMNHVGVNPMVDRSKQPHELPDVNVRVSREKDSGFYVSGAKMVGTAAVFTHCNLVFSSSPLPLGDKDADHALVFFVPTGARGLKLLCRPSYEWATRDESPFDYPLSSRFDENDATLVFDEVFVPWEDCLVYRDAQKANEFFVLAQVVQNLMLHGAVRFATKMEFMTGLLTKLAQQNGTIGLRGVRVRLGEAVGFTWMFQALLRDACSHPDPGPGGSVAPSHRSIFAVRSLAPMLYPRIRELMELVGAGGFIQLPSSAKDLLAQELRPYLDLYYQGSGVPAEERIKLWKLAWDAIGSEFGARQELFERNYAGNYDNVRLENVFLAERDGDTDDWGGMVARCMADYGLEGWRSPPWAEDAVGRED